MNVWTAVLLAADAAGVAAAVVRALREASREPDDSVRNIRLAEAGLVGTLVALVAWQAEALGLGGVLGLVAWAVVAGECLRCTMALGELGDRLGAPAPNALAALTAILVVGLLAIVGRVAVSRPPAPPGPPTVLGVQVADRGGAPTRWLSHTPALADADLSGAVAVPVERYHVDGSQLTLVVPHGLTCYVAGVLIGPDPGPGVVDVLVLSAPLVATPSAATPSGGCRGDPILTVRSGLDVGLPASIHASTVRDVGADGPTVRVA